MKLSNLPRGWMRLDTRLDSRIQHFLYRRDLAIEKGNYPTLPTLPTFFLLNQINILKNKSNLMQQVG